MGTKRIDELTTRAPLLTDYAPTTPANGPSGKAAWSDVLALAPATPLAAATPTTLGGVKIGDDLSISSAGVLTASARTVNRPPGPRFGKGLIAWYDFRQGVDATKLYDRNPTFYGNQGVGQQGTLGAGSAAPTWVSTGLQFDGSNDKVTLPAGILSRIKSVQYYGTFTGTGSGYNVVLTGDANADVAWIIDSLDGVYGPVPGIWKGGVGLAGLASWDAIPPGANGASGCAWVQDGVSDMYYVNGRPVSRLNGTFDTSTFGRTGTNVVIGLNPNNGNLTTFKGVLSHLALFDRALTDAEVYENHQFFAADAAARGLAAYANPSVIRQLSVETDSIGTNLSNTITDWPTVMSALLTQTWTITNRAEIGNTMGVITNGARHRSIDRFAAGAAKNVPVFHAGTNDFFWSNANPTDVFGYLKSVVLESVGLGGKPVVVPMLSRTGYDTPKTAYNALITGYAWPAAVALVPASAMPHLVPDGSSTNVTYFSDGTHPTQAGANEIAAAVAAVVNAL